MTAHKFIRSRLLLQTRIPSPSFHSRLIVSPGFAERCCKSTLEVASIGDLEQPFSKVVVPCGVHSKTSEGGIACWSYYSKKLTIQNLVKTAHDHIYCIRLPHVLTLGVTQ
ncbi:hypothetical protein PM082_017284 [Marasmius tenuissimus]|nr:hypothetical protein PM082_017284 [Marasmius tenuissimus]